MSEQQVSSASFLQPQSAQPSAPAQPTAQSAQPEATTPPWGDDFDPEKAWTLIQNLRKDNKERALDPELQRKIDAYDRLEQASKTELQRATEEATRWQTEADRWRAASVSSTVKALAAKDFADPDDAVRNLDASKYLGAGGEVDEKAIQADLTALLESKPHYRRAGENPAPRVPAPNPAQGSGSGTPAANPGAEFGAILNGMLAR